MAYVIFGASVRGASHIRKDTPKEDCAFFSKAENGYIMAVSDGHGDPRCMRSMIGSRLAVKAAVNALRGFPADTCEQENSEAAQRVDALCSRIAKSWKRSVREHLKANPLNEEERTAAGNLLAAYESGQRLAHIYGATLIACLVTQDFLLLVQKGDGHAVVVFDDAQICESFIPWDERCIGNITTSLCDEDAADTFTYRIVCLRNGKTIAARGISQNGTPEDFRYPDESRQITAVFLSTDGVEDSFSDMDGTRAFYADFLKRCAQEGMDAVTANLEQELTDMSERGSQDDISLTGIVDDVPLEGMCDAFSSSVELYLISKEYQHCADRLSSMERKRMMLKSKLTKAQNLAQQMHEAMEQAHKDAACEREKAQKAKLDNNDEFLALKREYDEIIDEYEAYLRRFRLLSWTKSVFDELHRLIGEDIFSQEAAYYWNIDLFDELEKTLSPMKADIRIRYEQAYKRYEVCDSAYQRSRAAEDEWRMRCEEANARAASAEAAFAAAQEQYETCRQEHDAYEQEYLSIEKRAQEAQQRMNAQQA